MSRQYAGIHWDFDARSVDIGRKVGATRSNGTVSPPSDLVLRAIRLHEPLGIARLFNLRIPVSPAYPARDAPDWLLR